MFTVLWALFVDVGARTSCPSLSGATGLTGHTSATAGAIHEAGVCAQVERERQKGPHLMEGFRSFTPGLSIFRHFGAVMCGRHRDAGH